MNLPIRTESRASSCSEVKRYGGQIAEAATAIRQVQWPDLPDDPQADIAFLPCALTDINDTVLDLLT